MLGGYVQFQGGNLGILPPKLWHPAPLLKKKASSWLHWPAPPSEPISGKPAWWWTKFANYVWVFFVKQTGHESDHYTRISLPNYFSDPLRQKTCWLATEVIFRVLCSHDVNLWDSLTTKTKPLKTQAVGSRFILGILAIQGHQHSLGWSKTSAFEMFLLSWNYPHPVTVTTRTITCLEYRESS